MTTETPTAREEFSGSITEIDTMGDYTIDTSEALNGDVHVVLAPGRSVSIDIGGRTVLEVTNDGSSTRIDLGGGSGERLVLGDALKALLNEFFQMKYDVHTHPTAMGPTGPPLPLFTGTLVTEDHLSSVARTKKS